MTIYILTDGTAYKIGYTSKHPDSRKKDFKTGNPRKLHLVGTVEGDKSKEDHLHLKYAHKQCYGGGREWFNLEQSDIDEILENRNEEHDDGRYREEYNPEWVYSNHVRQVSGGQQNTDSGRSKDVFSRRWEDAMYSIHECHVFPFGKEHDIGSKGYWREVLGKVM